MREMKANKTRWHIYTDMSQVDWNEDGSCWAEIGGGRKRWFPKNHRVTVALRESLTLDKLQKEIESTDVLRGGYYQRTVYYRDEEGKVCIPPDPSMVPEGRERLEVKNLTEAKALQREMTTELRRQFEEDHATEYLDQAQGNPREQLLRVLADPKSNYERDMVGYMLEVLDKEEKDRREVDAETTLRWMGT